MNQAMRTLVVANPRSAGGALGRDFERLAADFEPHLGAFEHRFTEAPRDATRIVREALGQGFERIIALGGDGTVSEVVDGFFADEQPIAPNAVLAVLPFGTGGDFRRTIGAPKKVQATAMALAHGEIRSIDIGRLHFIDHDGRPALRHFANIASFGISGLVSAIVNEGGKKLGGRLSFALATIKAMRRYKAQRARLTLDDGEPQESVFHVVAVANGQYFGGGMWMAPQARLDDGLFDVVTLAPMTFGDLVWRGNRVYKGTHIDLPQTEVARARRVMVEPVDANEAILLDVDGETPGRLPATFEVLPGAIRLQYPQVPAR